MLTTARIAEIAALVGDPTRAAMLVTLMDGRALTASELANASGVTAQTASGHLSRMVAAQLLTVERRGRYRYHRLATANVAAMLEGMMAIAAQADHPQRKVRTGPRDAALRQARCCYDHLAGRVAVGIADRMIEHGHIDLSSDGGALTASGGLFLQSIGVDLDAATARASGRRLFCRPCLDWSERRWHIAGTVGVALRNAFFGQGWMRTVEGSRIVTITPPGWLALRHNFALAPVD